MGVMEQIKGFAKKKTGDVTGQDDLQAEGRAQQEKGEAQTQESAERVKAQAAEKDADSLERRADGT